MCGSAWGIGSLAPAAQAGARGARPGYAAGKNKEGACHAAGAFQKAGTNLRFGGANGSRFPQQQPSFEDGGVGACRRRNADDRVDERIDEEREKAPASIGTGNSERVVDET